MICGMIGFYGYERPPAGSADSVVRNQFSFHNRPIISGLHHAGNQLYRAVGGSRTEQLDRVFGGHRRRRPISTVSFHQVPGCRPIAMAIEQRANYPAAKHTSESLVFRLWLPLSNYLLAVGKTAHMQSFVVSRATVEAGKLRSVGFLNALHWLKHYEALCSRIWFLSLNR